jgi:isopentenyl diphosphate isomerase/L-lactate dehydrogenase-like FMN-dependent dehydrogenase
LAKIKPALQQYYRERPDVAEILVMMDGGVKRGTDVFKALALGADLVFVGRPVLWGLSVDGERGVRQILQMLNDKLINVMALAGCQLLSQITASKIDVNPHHGKL